MDTHIFVFTKYDYIPGKFYHGFPVNGSIVKLIQYSLYKLFFGLEGVVFAHYKINNQID